MLRRWDDGALRVTYVCLLDMLKTDPHPTTWSPCYVCAYRRVPHRIRQCTTLWHLSCPHSVPGVTILFTLTYYSRSCNFFQSPSSGALAGVVSKATSVWVSYLHLVDVNSSFTMGWWNACACSSSSSTCFSPLQTSNRCVVAGVLTLLIIYWTNLVSSPWIFYLPFLWVIHTHA